MYVCMYVCIYIHINHIFIYNRKAATPSSSSPRACTATRMSCDLHTRTPARTTSTNFQLYYLKLVIRVLFYELFWAWAWA